MDDKTLNKATIINDEPYNYKVQFSMENRDIVVEFDCLDKINKHWEMSFAEKKNDKLTYNLTGSGEEIRVFHLVMGLAVEAFDKLNMKSLMARVRKNSERLSLYNRLVYRYFGKDFIKNIDDGGKNYEWRLTVSRVK